MVKVWEYARKPGVILPADAPATVARAEMRDREEPVAIGVSDEKTMKFVAYATWREVIQITSHYSNLRVKDIGLDYPVAYSEEDVAEVYEKMASEKVVGMPVLKSKEEPVVIGVVTVFDLLQGLLKQGFEPIAQTVGEVATREELEKYLTVPDERVNRVWSDLVYRGLPGKIVVRSREEKYPVGLITLREFASTARWFFHRESERGLKSIAKVKTIMLRGAPVATLDTPIHYAAKIMAENQLLLLPVIDPEKGEVVGVLTVYDVLRAYILGAKPGRAPVPVKIPLPKPVEAEERLVYRSTQQILQQVVVAKPPVAELSGIRVRDIARETLPAITINDTVEHARREMIRTRSSYLVVIDERGEIAGVVTKWSMLRAIALKGPIWKRRVHDRYFIDYVLDKNVPRIPADASIEEAALRMVEDRAEVAIVVDEEGKPVGFVTKDDLVEAYEKLRASKVLVENVMTPGRIGVVHPHHSLYHAIKRMQTFYLDAVAVAEGSDVQGVISANRLPFVALEDSVEGIKSRRLIWVRKLVKGAAKKGRYVKVTPLLAIDAAVRMRETVSSKATVLEAIRIMKEYNVDGVPVVDEKGRLVGVICKNDIIRDLARTAQERIERGLPLRVEEEKERLEKKRVQLVEQEQR